MDSLEQKLREYLSIDVVDVVIYHDECCDGFGGAWTFWLASKKRSREKDVRFIGASHYYDDDKIQNMLEICTDKNVVSIDFCYTTDILRQLNNVATKLIILDHHATTLEHIQAVNIEEQTILDIDRSGCAIAWDFCFPNEKMPEFLQYIQDRDLWRWELENTKHFTAKFYSSVDFDFEKWSEMLKSENVKKCIEEGKVIIPYEQSEINNLASKASEFSWDIGAGKPYKIQVSNCSTLTSKLGNQLSKSCDFALVWFYDHINNYIKVSLRSDSRGNNVNVEQIARKFGGGGHANASGFTWTKSIDDLLYRAKEYISQSNESRNVSSPKSTTFTNLIVKVAKSTTFWRWGALGAAGTAAIGAVLYFKVLNKTD
jgi:oligoribonuclease NrnB/cAMP/cGMP phosphodiesterase (DHH superfamily)